ncbi:hypothetical protein TNIN_109001 [Trichonephila inaurata madagascariensis]|uniref:Uncharacterized protein n=1 Tax=Trichonephila inaurata madagascariensis TaxID=2747483 RepID=A0A8X6YX50_9ARAC|nr:hypothetical protein TNIN_109001 [Trichonephila inaurata madagascariensis]
MSLADGQQTTGEAFTTQVIVEIDGKSVLTKFIIIPKTKGNRTLLGTDLCSSDGLILDVMNACWFFWETIIPTSTHLVKNWTPSKSEKMSCNTCQLREGEVTSLTLPRRRNLTSRWNHFKMSGNKGGSNKHVRAPHQNGNSPPISVSIIPLRKRGRPTKVQQTPGSSSGRRRNQRRRM